MKKIIIVNNNMKVGGVQKSLYNLLWAIEKQYDITLLLFGKVGVYAEQLPPSVKIIVCEGSFRYLGISQGECKRKADAIKRGFLALTSKILGRKTAIRLMLPMEPMLPDTYDCAISYLHNGRPEAFYGGTQDYVLNCIKADKKVAFLHCDYQSCGANHPENNRSMEHFDAIAACSDGCRRVFESILPHLSERCVTVRNCHRFDEIQQLADDNPISYDEKRIHIIAVARLSHEKGIERAIKGVACAIQKQIPATLHIVGGGAMENPLRALVQENGISDYVHFYGEQSNPYRYMKNADLFLLTSYHEAAPMVIDEARYLGIPVLTVKTTSSEEMVAIPECGWVCENSQEGIDQALQKILSEPKALQDTAERLRRHPMNNAKAIAQFAKLMGE